MSTYDPVAAAIEEDVGSGDLTCEYFIPAAARSRARIFAKENAVVAGTQTARSVFAALDPGVRVEIVAQDGSSVVPGETVLTISGYTRAILTGERVALNFLQRLSGIATLTAEFVKQVVGTGATILDTRKTTPGLRRLEKEAVRAGGGKNHRFGLYDAVMVKDNHLLAGPVLGTTLTKLRASHPNLLIELEAETIEQVREFAGFPEVDVILLDNMSVEQLRAAIALRRPGLMFEASGGVHLGTIRAIAETGVDFISVGQLTHSARAIDFSLEILG